MKRRLRRCSPLDVLLSAPMVLIVSALFWWTWYNHVIMMERDLFSRSRVALAVLDILCFHLLFISSQWAYLRTVLTSPGYSQDISESVEVDPLAGLECGRPEREEGSEAQPNSERSRFCQICQRDKPERAHHCRICNKCVMRMDHHCPWVANCVGRDNHKFFFLFVVYTPLTAIYHTITTSVWASQWLHSHLDAWLVVAQVWCNVLVCCSFGIILFAFAFYHAYLISSDLTTIESMSPSRGQPRPRSLGSMTSNCYAVMGVSKWRWFFPCA
uniref:Palmitoyltransferase n=1 Tax=Guillardia theta TaxID=55529 RepID=A0A7S4PR21_GUITH|mmetsp:Transcript_9772/g.32708  ORF Transcript_9772/g.32708 Transcript_9772/m.32708 type:complete len:271 (+) Transcript_9772:88-900(+)